MPFFLQNLKFISCNKLIAEMLLRKHPNTFIGDRFVNVTKTFLAALFVASKHFTIIQ